MNTPSREWESGAAQAADNFGYLTCYTTTGTKAGSPKPCINKLLQRGVGWQDLVRWPKEHGCDNPSARKILSQALTEAGIRRRKPGAGCETPQTTLALLAYALEKYGHDAIPLLSAAYRAGRARQNASGTAVNPAIAAA